MFGHEDELRLCAIGGEGLRETAGAVDLLADEGCRTVHDDAGEISARDAGEGGEAE